MDNLQSQKANLIKKMQELRNVVGGKNVQASSPPQSQPKGVTNPAPAPNIANNGSRGCGACSRKKNT